MKALTPHESPLHRLPVLRGIFPFSRVQLPRDVVAGITLAALGIPEVMDYTKIAGTPAVTGLYTILLPLVAFAFFGASKHLVVAAARERGFSSSVQQGLVRRCYVRQLRDMKGAFDVSGFDEHDLSEYAALCGQALAHAMAKAGDPALITGYLGSSEAFDEGITRFAVAYADRNERDWQVLKSAIKAGRIHAMCE